MRHFEFSPQPGKVTDVSCRLSTVDCRATRVNICIGIDVSPPCSFGSNPLSSKRNENDSVAAIILHTHTHLFHTHHRRRHRRHHQHNMPSTVQHANSLIESMKGNRIPCMQFNCQINISIIHAECMRQQDDVSVCSRHRQQSKRDEYFANSLCTMRRPWRSHTESQAQCRNQT